MVPTPPGIYAYKNKPPLHYDGDNNKLSSLNLDTNKNGLYRRWNPASNPLQNGKIWSFSQVMIIKSFYFDLHFFIYSINHFDLKIWSVFIYASEQSCFGTSNKTKIIRQCPSTTCDLVLCTKNNQRRLSYFWGHWCFRHCSRVTPFATTPGVEHLSVRIIGGGLRGCTPCHQL